MSSIFVNFGDPLSEQQKVSLSEMYDNYDLPLPDKEVEVDKNHKHETNFELANYFATIIQELVDDYYSKIEKYPYSEDLSILINLPSSMPAICALFGESVASMMDICEGEIHRYYLSIIDDKNVDII